MKTTCLFLASAAFAYLYYERYWRWRDCIEEANSSCLTSDGSNLTSGGQLWGLIAVVFLLIGLRSLYRSHRR
ncbi:hypothetical protein CEV32_4709 [Brucella rhizosphaerae]|uniref:Uncharacterized protein n=1 Tax=Brucella rhizosphaerae TaxID=571254 RepID=A0A256FKR7_9HYPH|nr:hypothetical protein CEV32_4709 [Brucella rhizosphaerae]